MRFKCRYSGGGIRMTNCKSALCTNDLTYQTASHLIAGNNLDSTSFERKTINNLYYKCNLN